MIIVQSEGVTAEAVLNPLRQPGSDLQAPVPRPTAAPDGASQRTIRRAVREDQICVLRFDRPGSAANIFDLRTLEELAEELEFIAGAPQLKGLVITSAKPSIFIAGADLRMISEAASPEEGRKLIEAGQQVMNRLAALPIPSVAAIHGAAVGGGCELCLACDYRVASLDRATKIGLPETQLGLLPAWGGSTRLPRLVGLPKALDIILAGKTLAAKPALKCGLVDELAPVEYLLDVAVRLTHRGKPHRPARRWVNNWLVASVLAARVRSQLLKKTRGNYPAVLKALAVATRGLSKSLSSSLQLERDGMLELMQTEACRNLVRVFFLQERARKQRVHPTGSAGISAGVLSGLNRFSPAAMTALPVVEPKPVGRAAVVGGGVMGAGIAQWLSAHHLPVILRDLNTEQVAKGMANIAKVYQEGVKRHVFSPREARDGFDRVSPAATEVPLRRVDLVIEAAAEDFDIKRKIFQRLDELTGEETMLATNTSALPISELAASTRWPERVLGLHFFNPVHRMQLVEVISAHQTSPEVLQRALRFVQQIGKLPVLVRDSPGFLVNRILMPYLVEAGNLFEAGVDVTSLDEAMLDFGLPMGPMRLLDEVGIDVACHVAQTLATTYREHMVVPAILGTMVQTGLLGRKNGRGFYLHAKGREPRPNPQVTAYQSATIAPHSPVALQQRMVLLMVNEAARCLEEAVVAEPADVYFAMIMGTGFAPFRGGPLRYADSLGAGNVVGALEALAQGGAAHFAPCGLLRSMAAAGQRFYPDTMDRNLPVGGTAQSAAALQNARAL
jgi:3-hydroxyacyl-CoA dehydrogenase / enoyl-CoA hydratase / 3-hydroxybutyryl-CoA epimerase